MKVLQLVTYPTLLPRHGGQIRVSQIRSWLENRGHIVKTISICEPGHDAYGPNDLIVDFATEKRPYDLPFCFDLLTSKIARKTGSVFDFLSTRIQNFKPDCIFVEQPWLWPPLQRLIDDGLLDRARIKLVYSSQNVEFSTKTSILQEVGCAKYKIEEAAEEIRFMEQSLLEASDYVIAVTQNDAMTFSSMASTKVIVCPNGVARRVVDPNDVNLVNAIYGNQKYLIYIGSAYPPNAAGFWETVGPSLAMFNPNESIALVGGMADIIDQYAPPDSALSAAVNAQVVKKVGKVSDDLLAALIYGAAGFILPLRSGGGSNLKTAEAIASGLPVVATSVAMRGYEHLIGLNNLFVADDRIDFIKYALSFLREPLSHHPDVTKDDDSLRQSVYWENALSKLESVVT